MARIPMTIDSLRVHPENFEKIVILKIEHKGADLYLPFAIGQAEFDALTIRMQSGTSLTPLTHDLFVSVTRRLGASVNSIILSDFRKGTFYARLLLDVDRVHVELDCRPSDALNIALSSEAPMFIEEEVLHKVGFRPENGEPLPDTALKIRNDLWHLATTTVEDSSSLYNLRLS